MKIYGRRKMTARSSSQRGMTLIEIMVVIAILGVLATAIGFGVVNYLKKGKEEAARLHLGQIAEALTAYYATEGEYPSNIDDLTQGKSPLLNAKNLKDPWKQEVVYRQGGDGGAGFELCSKGPDKREGSEDDICHEGD